MIAKLDRLSRNAAFLLTLRDSGVRFAAVDLPEANDLTVGIMALVAQQEREAISRRTAADAGEAGEKQEPHDVELGARCDEAAGQREDEDRDQVEDGSGRHRSPLGGWHSARILSQ